MRLLGVFAAAVLTLCGCATPAKEPPWNGYYVMRHLHTPAGERDPDLTAEGQSQALVLADWFGSHRPRVIYVSSFRRSQQTAAPTAAKLALTPIVYDPSDTAALVARVRAGPKPALIVGHSNTVPDIVEQLGGARPGPLVHEDFGDVWRVGSSGSTERLKISEVRPEPRP
jgi:broad specificity phosphatase PhoE